MLSYIDIHNVAVIEHAQIEFSDGLNILTGETGAGKSIIIDAIGMILGHRTSRDIIRSGEQKASVSALFYVRDGIWDALKDMGIEPTEDGSLLIYREISSDGRGMCRINNIPMPVAVLKDVGKFLINIHGQQDTTELYSAEKHIDLLDGWAKDEIGPALDEYKEIYNEYKRLEAEVKRAEAEEHKLNSEIDLLEYQINEISALNMHKGEAEELEEKINSLANMEKITNAATKVRGLLMADNINVRDSLHIAVKDFSAIADINQSLQNIYSELIEVTDKIEEIADMIEELEDDSDFDMGTLDAMQERQYEIRKLSAKYRCSSDGLLEFLEEAQSKLESLSDIRGKAEQSAGECERLLRILAEKAGNITQIRRRYAKTLETEIVAQLESLNMKGAEFEVKIDPASVLNSKGGDEVEFLISANPGEDIKPLAKIASGGELSRIMLSLKSIISAYDIVETYIFDEIDTGISGITAEKVADKLICVAEKNQTVIITHSPHIAAIADRHYLIKKEVTDGKTSTRLSLLDEDGRVAEIARINSGTHMTEAALAHARELLKIRKG